MRPLVIIRKWSLPWDGWVARPKCCHVGLHAHCRHEPEKPKQVSRMRQQGMQLVYSRAAAHAQRAQVSSSPVHVVVKLVFLCFYPHRLLRLNQHLSVQRTSCVDLKPGPNTLKIEFVVVVAWQADNEREWVCVQGWLLAIALDLPMRDPTRHPETAARKSDTLQSS